MLLIGLDRVIAAANQASEPLFGRSAGSLVGMSWQAVLDDPDEAVGDAAPRQPSPEAALARRWCSSDDAASLARWCAGRWSRGRNL